MITYVGQNPGADIVLVISYMMTARKLPYAPGAEASGTWTD